MNNATLEPTFEDKKRSFWISVSNRYLRRAESQKQRGRMDDCKCSLAKAATFLMLAVEKSEVVE